MKNRRAIMWLSLALALVVGAHLLLLCKGGTAAALVQRTCLLDAKLADASRITVSRAGEPAAVLSRDDGWRLVEPYSALVDERVALKLLDSLAAGDIQDTISDQELLRLGRTRADLGLSGEAALTVSVSSDESSQTILFGGATPIGEGVYAAVGGEDAVYVVPSNVFAAADLPAEGFRQRAVLPGWTGTSVTSFDLKRGASSFLRFVRDGDMWQMRAPSESSANAAKIRRLLGDLSQAEAIDFVWPVGAPGESSSATASLLAGYGLEPESAVTLTFKGPEGGDRQISFGKDAKDGRVYALVQNAGAIVTVDGALKDQVLARVAEFTDTRLFPFERALATRISLVDGDVSYLLAKDGDGTWRLDAPVAAPTDNASVEALLDRIFALKSTDIAAEGVAVSASTSAPPVTVSREAALGDIRPADLRSREIVKIDPAAVKRIVVSGTREDVSATAVVWDKDRRAWNVEQSPVPGTVDVKAIEALTEALNPLLARRVTKLKVTSADLHRYGLDAPCLTVAIDQDREDSVRRNILVGYETVGGAFATLGSTDAVFVLPRATIDRLSAPLVRKDADAADGGKKD